MSEFPVSEYPKLMFRNGEEIAVVSVEDEAEKSGLGFALTRDAAPVADVPPTVEADEPVESDEPTFGPPGDQTHAKRPSRGGKKR